MDAYNIAILGKSGIGKSSLLNYLFDKDVAKIGSGKPVTEKGFHKFETSLSGKNMNVYDSWGIEAGKTDIWMKDFERFLKDKKSVAVKEWLHTVLYCFSAEGKRVEDYELEIIRKLKNEHLNPIIVITKSDLDKDQIFYNEVKKNFPTSEIILVCAAESTIGLGSIKKISKKSGVELLQTAIFNNSTISFKKRFFIIRDHILKERATRGKNYIMRRLSGVLLEFDTNFLGALDDAQIEAIISRAQKLVYNYDLETKEQINILINDANDFYSNIFIPLFSHGNKKLKFEDDERSTFQKQITSLGLGGAAIGANSILFGSMISGLAFLPILLPISAFFFIKNRTTKEKLIAKIEESVEKHFSLESIEYREMTKQ